MTAPAAIERAASLAPGKGNSPSAVYMPKGSSTVIEGEQPRVLRMIRRSEIDLAIWRRELPAALSSWLDASPIGEWPSLRHVLAPAEIARTLRRHFDGAGIEHCDGRAMLIDDVTRLATLYADALRVTHVHLRLEPVHDNACTKFHRDCVIARLVTTYHGPGTEWVTAENAAKALSLQHDYDGQLLHVPTQSVAMFKGCLGGGEAGVHHRSPQIARTGVTRLFLCANASKPPADRGA